ncbi:hypothetical protein C0Q70_13925 [Pomacea canaliculata]|uniref:Uncharacterized protein n=1 Tax=Pomacea canaliculata TaxID=400727 RepID=A0A2T7NYK0_POMCA|nr:hypothetical protein C0Q70_13925 [Pomacea canaliculata]
MSCACRFSEDTGRNVLTNSSCLLSVLHSDGLDALKLVRKSEDMEDQRLALHRPRNNYLQKTSYDSNR